MRFEATIEILISELQSRFDLGTKDNFDLCIPVTPMMISRYKYTIFWEARTRFDAQTKASNTESPVQLGELYKPGSKPFPLSEYKKYSRNVAEK